MNSPRPLLLTFLAAVLCLTARAGTSTDVTAAFESANRLYEENQFPAAADAYQNLLQSGPVSPALWFNLGNARFKSGQIGLAITAYREAQNLAPRDPDIRANLQFARNQVQGPSLRPAAWQRWLGRMTLDEWTLLTTAPFWAWLLLLVAASFRPVWRANLRNPARIAGAVTGVLCLGTAAAFAARGAQTSAIVSRAEAVVHNGPLDESPAAFTAHDGAELAVVDHKDDWLEVDAGDQRLGWIKRDQVVTPNFTGREKTFAPPGPTVTLSHL